MARKCLPNATNQRLLDIAQDPGSLYLALRSSNPLLTKADVELIAVSIDVFDEVWPGKEDYRKYLHVTSGELLAAKRTTRKQGASTKNKIAA